MSASNVNLLSKTPMTSTRTSNLLTTGQYGQMIVTKEESTSETLAYVNQSNQIDRSYYPTLQNVVSTVNLSCSLDLKKIALQCRNAEYNPKRFAAVIMRLREPKTTALIFHSGKIVCTGAKDETASLTAAKKYARMIQKLGFEVKFKDFKIQNIVGSCDVKFPIKLDMLNQKHHEFTQYEPEIFPGLIYRMCTPKIVLLIFVSGKLVLTGAKEKKEIDLAFENIYYVLKECKKQENIAR